MLFDAHTRAFAAFGGIPRRGIYDNMKTAVDRVGRGKERTVNARFQAMCGHYLFEPEFCNPAAAGRRAWSRRTCRTAVASCGARPGAALARLAELNAWLAERCRALGETWPIRSGRS